MSVFTLQEIEEQITAFKRALMAISTGQEYSIGNRRMTRADLPEIRNTLDWLAAEKRKIQTQGGPQILVGRPKR